MPLVLLLSPQFLYHLALDLIAPALRDEGDDRRDEDEERDDGAVRVGRRGLLLGVLGVLVFGAHGTSKACVGFTFLGSEGTGNAIII